MSVHGECFGPEDCASKAVCEPSIHPFFLFAVASVVGTGTAWLGLRTTTLGLGVALAALGALLGLSLGVAGWACGLVLVLAGTFTRSDRVPRERAVVAGAWLAALAPFPTLLAFALLAPPVVASLAFAIVFLPFVAWWLFVAATRRRAAG